MADTPTKRDKAHSKEKSWFDLLIEFRSDLEGRCFKAEERLRELEDKVARLECESGEPRRIGPPLETMRFK